MKTTQTKHVRPLFPFGGRGALLLLLWGLGVISWAQTTVTPLGEKFDTNEVIFSVTMSPATPTWVFVEYTTNPHNPESMSRATFTSASTGTLAAGNQGFWLTNSATVTAKLKDVSGKFSWCAYAINVPPNAEVKANGGYTLRGTPPFTINNSITIDNYDFGPGTCIATITDDTYNPAGFLRTPPMTVTATAPATVCAGAPLTFTATASGGTTTAMSYTWNIAGKTTPTTTTTHTTALADAGKATYTVFVTNANSCTSMISPTGTVTVYDVPAAPTNASSNTRCGSGTVTFSATVPDGTTIDWYDAASGSSTVSSGTTSYSPDLTASTTYYAQTKNTTTGCISTSRLAVTATVNAVPATPTGASSNTRCGSGTVTFSATVPGGTTIDWYDAVSDGSTVSSGTTSYSPNLTASATYYAQARNNTTGCVSAGRLPVTATVEDPIPGSVGEAATCAKFDAGRIGS